MSDDELDKRERAERGLEDVRAMMIEMLDEGSHKWPKANAEIDAARALEGIDGAEDVPEKWDEREHEGEWRCEVMILRTNQGRTRGAARRS